MYSKYARCHKLIKTDFCTGCFSPASETLKTSPLPKQPYNFLISALHRIIQQHTGRNMVFIIYHNFGFTWPVNKIQKLENSLKSTLSTQIGQNSEKLCLVAVIGNSKGVKCKSQQQVSEKLNLHM